jgi:hypothetical protein
VIEIITRIRDSILYDRMRDSAQSLASEVLTFSGEVDTVGLPMVAETYNNFGNSSKADILVFAEDDAVFMTPDWNETIEQEFKATKADVLGVVGCDKFIGGSTFCVGHPHCFGKYVTMKDEYEVVKVFSRARTIKRLAVADAFFLAVKREAFDRGPQFDEQFDEMFFYGEDFCLNHKTYLSDILMGHHKPDRLYGVYPKAMKPIEAYEPQFYAKHGLTRPTQAGDHRCALVSVPTFYEMGQDGVFVEFKSKYMRGSCAT